MDDREGVEGWLRAVAYDDLRTEGGVRPMVVAYAADHPLVLARLRPFRPGEGESAVTEVLDVAVALGADRLAACFGGWARRLPGGPQVEGRSDAREIVLIAVAQRRNGAPAVRCTITACEHTGGRPRWGRTVASDGMGGWLAATLARALDPPRSGRTTPPSTPGRATMLALRCITLGHELHVPVPTEATRP